MDLNYTIREMCEPEFTPLFEKHAKVVFEGDHSYSVQNLLSETEKKNMDSLNELMGSPYKLYLGVFNKENEFVGWSWGSQENRSTFYMVNSGILHEHRRKGLYGELVKCCVEILSNKGFQLIYSRHCATNNDVIIPKLKAGFIISKMEIDDRFGVLVHLHFYTNKNRRKIMDYRSGQSRPDETIKDIFNI